jgi:hypothetical protein
MKSVLVCGHLAGTVITVSSAKLKVLGESVLLRSSIEKQQVIGCQLKPPPNGTIACQTVMAVQKGLAAKLSVGGAPVVLATLKGTTNGSIPTDVPPTPQSHLAATSSEPKLTAAEAP